MLSRICHLGTSRLVSAYLRMKLDDTSFTSSVVLEYLMFFKITLSSWTIIPHRAKILGIVVLEMAKVHPFSETVSAFLTLLFKAYRNAICWELNVWCTDTRRGTSSNSFRSGIEFTDCCRNSFSAVCILFGLSIVATRNLEVCSTLLTKSTLVVETPLHSAALFFWRFTKNSGLKRRSFNHSVTIWANLIDCNTTAFLYSELFLHYNPVCETHALLHISYVNSSFVQPTQLFFKEILPGVVVPFFSSMTSCACTSCWKLFSPKNTGI